MARHVLIIDLLNAKSKLSQAKTNFSRVSATLALFLPLTIIRTISDVYLNTIQIFIVVDVVTFLFMKRILKSPQLIHGAH